jgi:DNA-binding MarR family transcriptional regulator
MYQSAATDNPASRMTPRAAVWIDRLPIKVHSPGLGRTVRISEQQRALLVILAHRPAQRLRPLAAEAGYADAAGVSRALRALERTGIIARSSTRGRRGSTVAWVRAGARMLRGLADLMREALERARPGNVSAYTEQRTYVLPGQRVDTFRTQLGVRSPISTAMRAARALLDPALFPDQARPGGADSE